MYSLDMVRRILWALVPRALEHINFSEPSQYASLSYVNSETSIIWWSRPDLHWQRAILQTAALLWSYWTMIIIWCEMGESHTLIYLVEVAGFCYNNFACKLRFWSRGRFVIHRIFPNFCCQHRRQQRPKT